MHLHPIFSYELANAIVNDRHRAAADRSNSPRYSRPTQSQHELLERQSESHQRSRQRVRDSLLRIPSDT